MKKQHNNHTINNFEDETIYWKKDHPFRYGAHPPRYGT